MRFLIGLILLGFPIAEIWLLFKLGQHYGGWLLLYLVVVSYLGLRLIREEKQTMREKMLQSIASTGGNPIKAMLGTARNFAAGVMLLIPGIMTDIIAVLLLLIPIRQAKISHGTSSDGTYYESYQHNRHRNASNDDVIEGEYTKVHDKKEQKTTIEIEKK